MPVTPVSKAISVRFAKDLKPHISSFLSCIAPLVLIPFPGRRRQFPIACEPGRIHYRRLRDRPEGKPPTGTQSPPRQKRSESILRGDGGATRTPLRNVRLDLQGLARPVLPARRAAASLGFPLRRNVSDRRNQQYDLPLAAARDVSSLASRGAAGICVLRESQPLHDASEEAPGLRRASRPLSGGGARTGSPPRTDPLPAASLLEVRRGPPARLRLAPSPRSSARL